MARIIFAKGGQSKWINDLVKKFKMRNTDLALICHVSGRTLRDWRREKFNISDNALLKLCNHFNLSFPLGVKTVPDYWYVLKGARKGALRRMELYGPPGTPEGRRKGGRISQLKRKENPQKYRELGCNVRKDFNCPPKTETLAEVVGIILGDGGVTNYQVKVTLDNKVDKEYATFVRQLMFQVLGELPSYKERNDDNSICLTLSGANLIDILSTIGIKRGNKILQQVDFPKWIWKKKEYQIACVRGLFDTDGCVYFHHHWTKGIKYRNLGLCFTSWSKPLLQSVHEVLRRREIKHSIQNDERIYVYSLKEVKKYFRIFCPSNPKFNQRLNFHESNSRVIEKRLEKSPSLVEGADLESP